MHTLNMPVASRSLFLWYIEFLITIYVLYMYFLKICRNENPLFSWILSLYTRGKLNFDLIKAFIIALPYMNGKYGEKQSSEGAL